MIRHWTSRPCYLLTEQGYPTPPGVSDGKLYRNTRKRERAILTTRIHDSVAALKSFPLKLEFGEAAAHAIALGVRFLLAGTADSEQTEAEKLIEAGHWKKARAIVETRIRQTPDDALANFLLSQVRNALWRLHLASRPRRKAPLPRPKKAFAHDSQRREISPANSAWKCWASRRSMRGQSKFCCWRAASAARLTRAILLDPHDVQAQRD